MLSIKLEQSVSNNSAVIEKKPAELKNKSPKYKVLLHNDPVNSMEYVTISLREVVPQLSEQDAIATVSYTHLRAHETNQDLVCRLLLEKKPAELKNKSPKYKVLLHNDPVNSMEYVAISLREVVPQLSEQDAIAIMLEAHNTGVGLVIVCDLEPAEFYSESLKSKGISSSIEKED